LNNVRLTDEKIADVKEYLNRSIKVTVSSLIPQLSKYGIDLIDTIEALQQENNGWRERYDELDAGHSRLFKDFCKLQQENEQLRAQVARYKEILEQASDALKYAEGYTQYSAEARVREAVAAIDKALGGKEE